METINTIIEGPIPNILILAGITFLLLSVIGNIGAKIVVEPRKQKYAGILGAVLLIIGLGLHIVSDKYRPNVRTSNCEQLEIEIRNIEEELQINMRDRERAIEEMSRIKPLLKTDPDAHEAYQHQEHWLRQIEERINELGRQIEELRNEKDKACA